MKTTTIFGCADCGKQPFRTADEVHKHFLTDCPAHAVEKASEPIDHDVTINTLLAISIAIAAALLAGAFRFFEPRG